MVTKIKMIQHFRMRQDGDFQSLLDFALKVIPILEPDFRILNGEFFDRKTNGEPYVFGMESMSFGSKEQGFIIESHEKCEPKYGGIIEDIVSVTAYGLTNQREFYIESGRVMHDPPYLKLTISSLDEKVIDEINEIFHAYFTIKRPMNLEELEFELLKLNAAMRNNAWSSAKKIARIILKEKSKHPKALFALGVALAVEGKMDKALIRLQEVLEIDKEDYDAWYNLGVCYFTLQQYQQALEAFKESLRIKADNHPVFWMLGQTFEQLEKNIEALRAYKDAVRTTPNPLGLGYTGKDFTTQAQKAINRLKK